LRASVPGLKAMSRASLKGCLLRYIAYGWTGATPKARHSTLVFVPVNAAPWLWGWPNRFLARMAAVDSAVFVIGPYHGGGFPTRIDGHAERSRLPENYGGGMLANEIETVAAWFQSRK
jgi:glycerophosphoryl diester phosphodiesterase